MDGLAEYCGQHAYTQLSWNDIPRDLGRSPGSNRRDWDGEQRLGSVVAPSFPCAHPSTDADILEQGIESCSSAEDERA